GLGPQLGELIRKISQKAKGKKVVFLIDEYDKPLVDYIDQPKQAEKNRDILKSFFSAIKDADAHLKFLFITGVSKFSKVSLFSDLNHLRDITLVNQFAEIAGYSEKELEDYFASEIQELAKKQQQEFSVLKSKIKEWYNGYSWDIETRIYNPFSILNFFASQKFANYWWDTGTPTFLIKLLRNDFHYNLEEIEVGSAIFESYTLENLEWRSLLFQTGYLTILNYDEDFQVYTLGYPNKEVKDSMLQHLLGAFRETSITTTKPLYAKMKRALDTCEIRELIKLIDVLFSTIPHQIFIEKQEAFFHAVLHLTFQGLGLFTQSEVSTAKGRVDTVIHSKSYIYVIEFKLNATAQEALNQIREKRYGNAYLNQGLEVIAIGISFNSETKSVGDWKALPYKSLLIEG
ncbi:MAG: AAA family ATPase, partial [Bacteroidetes bacterium]|nr:AAA family ATPase [Bacteroidota bacterium]